MRYLVLSDIHANIDALDTVLAAASRMRYEHVLVLGDLIGYGAAPNDVVDRVRALSPLAAIRGNHDKAAADLSQTENFNPLARLAAEWTRDALSPDSVAYLTQLPAGPIQVNDSLEICHGTPFDEDAYIFDGLDAVRAINAVSRPLCLFGHTHVPLIISLEDGAMGYDDVDDGRVMPMNAGGRYLVNVGSVGQPRDGDARASFGVVDTEAQHVEFCRVAYPVAAAQARIRQAGLPEALALRLAAGR